MRSGGREEEEEAMKFIPAKDTGGDSQGR